MDLTIENIPAAMFKELAHQAAEHGVSVEDFVLQKATGGIELDDSKEDLTEQLEDFLSRWKGKFSLPEEVRANSRLADLIEKHVR